MDIRQDIPKIIEAILEIDNRVKAIKVLNERHYDEGTRETFILIEELECNSEIEFKEMEINANISRNIGRESPYTVTLVGTIREFVPGAGSVIYER